MTSDEESRRVKEAIDEARQGFPAGPRVEEVRFELGEDSTGDPAVFVITLLDEQTRDEDWTSKNLRPIEDCITNAVAAIGLERLVYVRFTRPSELNSNGAGA